MLRRALLIGWLIALSIGASAPARAQSTASYDVFSSKSGLYFVDTLTGLSSVVAANGISYTLVGNGVIFLDRATGLVQIATPDGQVAPHPFLPANAQWVVSADRNWIAWVVTRTENGSILADLYAARADGGNPQLALHTSSSKGLSLRPLAISNDGADIFYTRQSDDAKTPAPYPFAADIYRVMVAGGAITHLIGEPRCRCGATFSGDGHLFFRLESNLTAHFIDLSANLDVPLTPPSANYTAAGDPLLSDRGSVAVYSAVKTAGTKYTPGQYALILADSSQKGQRILIDGNPNWLRPVLFEQNVLILVGVDKDGTFKLSLTDGTLTQVSAYSYLGTLSG
jgi:hypothetical protein